MATTIIFSILGSSLLFLSGAFCTLIFMGWPNRPLAETESDDSEALLFLATSLGWGFGVVPATAFWIHLLTSTPLTFWLVAGTAGGFLVAAGVLAVNRIRGSAEGWKNHRMDGIIAGLKSNHRVILACVLTGLVYFIKYDGTHPVLESCIYKAALHATGLIPLEADLLTENIDDARLGNTALLAMSLVVFRDLGFHVLYALCGFLIAMGGYLIGRITGGRAAWGWIGMVFLALNPYVLTIMLPDENLFALTVSAFLLPLALRQHTSFLALGVLFGLLVAMRHVMILAMPALLLVACRSPARTRNVGLFSLAFLIFTLPMHLHHLLALGSILRFESHTQFPPLEYDILGWKFHWHGMLNWPFHDETVRTPHNPYPTFLLWPLYLAGYLGLGLFTLLTLGFGILWRYSAPQATFWILWSVPVLFFLAVQESWDHANKMGVIVIVFSAFTAWLVAGGRFVRHGGWKGLLAVASIALCAHVSILAVRDWRVPADERYFRWFGKAAGTEIPSLVDRAAAEVGSVGLLPDFQGLDRYSPGFLGQNLSLTADRLMSPGSIMAPTPMLWFPQEIPPRGEEITLEIDLSQPPFDRPFLTVTTETPHRSLASGETTLRIHGLDLPWDERDMNATVSLGRGVTGVILSFEETRTTGSADRDRWSENKNVEYQCEFLSWMTGAMKEPCPSSNDPTFEHPSSVLRLGIPEGPLTLAIAINTVGENLLIWKALATRHGVELLEEGERFWHN